MVEIRSKKTNKVLLIGEIIKETDTTLKLHTSSRIYKKKNVVVQYVIAVLIICFASCTSLKPKAYSLQQLKALKKTDSIKYAQIMSRMLDYQEEYYLNDDRDYNQHNDRDYNRDNQPDRDN